MPAIKTKTQPRSVKGSFLRTGSRISWDYEFNTNLQEDSIIPGSEQCWLKRSKVWRDVHKNVFLTDGRSDRTFQDAKDFNKVRSVLPEHPRLRLLAQEPKHLGDYGAFIYNDPFSHFLLKSSENSFPNMVFPAVGGRCSNHPISSPENWDLMST